MTDPLRFETSAASAQLPERERDARVEELLLGGLDHYFAAHYDLAINVWTRVLFLDRGHARARAYIERARRAISEQQRYGEELVQTGAEAFQRGESEAARRLLTSAVEYGAGSDEAMALLARLDRLAAAGVQRESRGEPAPVKAAGHAEAGAGSAGGRSWIKWTLAGALIGAATVAVAIGAVWTPQGASLPWLSRRSLGAAPANRAIVRPVEEPVPVLSTADVWLARARAQKDRGHLRDALVALDSIRPGDKRSAEAEKLRGEIQAALLAAGRAAAFGWTAPDQDTDRR
jgi:hypothetical protein